VNSNDATDKTFTVSTYVTYYNNNLTSNSYRVTTHVSWASAVRSGTTQTVEAQTLIFPNGCASIPDHPYSGPCQSSFTASALSDPGTITVDGDVAGIDLATAVLSSGAVGSDVTIEQTARVDGLTRGAGAVVQAVGGTEASVGHPSASSQADNDPGATKSIYETNDLPAPAAASTSLSGSLGSLAASITAGNSGRTTSTTSASVADSRPCPNLTGITNETDALPCGGSSTGIGAGTTLAGTLNVGPLSAAALPLAAISAPVAASTAITDRTTSTGVDTARATLTRSAASFSLGGLPNVALIKPAAFDYFVKLNSYTDSVSAQAGPGSVAPTTSTTGGTLTFWTGGLLSPYTTVNLSTITPSNIPAIPALNLSIPLLNTTVALSAVITPESKTTTSSCAGTCTRTSASYKITPITISVTLRIVVAGITAVDTTIVVDPGTVNAKASYVAAATR
jgi:hypothetical protein